MAEVEKSLVAYPDLVGGVCRFIAVCEDTQTEPHPENPAALMRKVVRIRLQNSTTRKGLGRWMHSNGETVTGAVLPGADDEVPIAPARQVYEHQLDYSLAWGAP